MEHLSSTSTIAIDELPWSSNEHHFCNAQLDTLILPTPLEELRLDYSSSFSLLTENIAMLSSLRQLSLSHSNVRSLPETSKTLTRLKYLDLSNCRRLESLPELPHSIEEFIVVDCTSLETMFPSTAELLEDQKESPEAETIAFANCIKLDSLSVKIIMTDACARMKRVVYRCLKTLEENEDGRASNQHYYQRVHVCLPGRQVPDWFKYTEEELS